MKTKNLLWYVGGVHKGNVLPSGISLLIPRGVVEIFGKRNIMEEEISAGEGKSDACLYIRFKGNL